jgi:acyl-CoA thioester hydrolase
MLDRLDLEPLFFAPFVSSVMRVEPGWIDYNGHLNMAYYNVLFDRAVDEAFELIGCGANYEQLFHATEGWVSATSENMSLHVDMQSKKTAAFPSEVAACLARMKAAHAKLPLPEAAGRRIAMPAKA